MSVHERSLDSPGNSARQQMVAAMAAQRAKEGMGYMSLGLGAIYVPLEARFNGRGFDLLERRTREARQDANRPVVQHLKVETDERGFDRYTRGGKRVERANDDMIRGSARLRTSFSSLYVGGAGIAGGAGSL